MLYADGSLNKTVFIEDGLHMNMQGYDIWVQTIEPLMNQFRSAD